MAHPSPPSRKEARMFFRLFAVSPSTQRPNNLFRRCLSLRRQPPKAKKKEFGLQTKHLTTPALSTQASYPPSYPLLFLPLFLILSADTDAHFCLALTPPSCNCSPFYFIPVRLVQTRTDFVQRPAASLTRETIFYLRDPILIKF